MCVVTKTFLNNFCLFLPSTNRTSVPFLKHSAVHKQGAGVQPLQEGGFRGSPLESTLTWLTSGSLSGQRAAAAAESK